MIIESIMILIGGIAIGAAAMWYFILRPEIALLECERKGAHDAWIAYEDMTRRLSLEKAHGRQEAIGCIAESVDLWYQRMRDLH